MTKWFGIIFFAIGITLYRTFLNDHPGAVDSGIVGAVSGGIGGALGALVEHFLEKRKNVGVAATSEIVTIDEINNLENNSNEISIPYLYGFGGWLYLVAFGLILVIGQSVFYLYDTLLPLYTSGQMQVISQKSPVLAFALLYETIFNIFNVVIILIAAYQCYRLKKSFKKTMIIFYIINLTLGGIYILIVSIVPEIDQTLIKQQINALIRAAVLCAVWVPYFIRSKRVENTYIN